MTTAIMNRAPAATSLAASPMRTTILAWAAGLITLLIRLALHGRSFDVFGDEILYTDLGRSVISGGFPRYNGPAGGQGPFFLHGPGYFYLEAGWAHLAGTHNSLMGWIYEMRVLNALLAGATAAVLVLLATRAASLWAGAAAGLLFALEPFCIRQNDRVLLETAMMLWLMLGYLVFSSLIGEPPRRRGWPRAVCAGFLFGCAVLTKDEAALLAALPLLAAAAFRWGPRWSLTLLTIGTTVAVYAAYVAVVVANGQFSGLWAAKTSGIRRMLGLVQISGFNSSGGGSLSSRLIAEANYFGTTYIVLALAVPSLVVVLRRGAQLPQILGLLYCAAGVTLAYAMVLGTLEEQELYLLIVPTMVVMPVAATLLFTGRRRPRRSAQRSRSTIPRAAMIVALTLVLSINITTCVQWLRQPDDGFAHLLQYMTTHIPGGTRVGVTEDNLNARYGLAVSYRVEIWITPADQSREPARYFLVQWGLIDQGYSTFSPSQVRHIVGDTRPVFSFSDRTFGQLALYRLPPTVAHLWHQIQDAGPRRCGSRCY